jgi:hypothetical protein
VQIRRGTSPLNGITRRAFLPFKLRKPLTVKAPRRSPAQMGVSRECFTRCAPAPCRMAPMASPELLAIVEVDQAQRVVCQAEGCGHGVYRRIHVVRCADSRVRVYGSDCFGRLFHGLIPEARPRYGSGDGRPLTDEERAMLVANTESLVAQFETEHQAALEVRRLRDEQQQRLELAAAERAAAARREMERRRPPTPAEIASVEHQAKAIVREKYGVDNPDAPGWRGLVLKHARELLGKP